MINVSNSFKKTIKSDVRECKGYVEVITKDYIDKANYTINRGSISDIAEITTYNQINNNKRVANKYASFEKDYFLLDGSFILPSLGENQDAGYISDSVSYEEDEKHLNGEFNDIEIRITSNLESTEGITLYFDDEVYPTNLYYYKDSEKIEIYNDTSVLNIFDTITFKNGIFSIYFNRLNSPNRRLRIIEIDLGITHVYQNHDLIEFTINEKVDVLKQEMPINECDVTLNNINYQFDPIQPNGIAKYFDGAIVKPYIGVLTENAGIEYCLCGFFYVIEWKNSNDTTKLTCQTIFKKMSETYSYITQTSTKYTDIEDYIYYMFMMWGYKNYKYLGTTENRYIFDFMRGKTSQLDNLRDVLVFCNLIGYVDREGNIVIDNIKKEVVDTLNLTECKEIPTLQIQNIINSLTINIAESSLKQEAEEILVEQNFEITGERNQVIILEFESNNYVFYNSTIQPSYEVSRPNWNFIFLVFNVDNEWFPLQGEPQKGTTTITLKKIGSKSIVYTPKTFNLDTNGDSLEIKNTLFNKNIESYAEISLNRLIENTKNFILSQNMQYLIDVSYNGDPSLEAGDLINLETRYGYKIVRIKEHQLTFNGSLSGTIKGCGN